MTGSRTMSLGHRREVASWGQQLQCLLPLHHPQKQSLPLEPSTRHDWAPGMCVHACPPTTEAAGPLSQHEQRGASLSWPLRSLCSPAWPSEAQGSLTAKTLSCRHCAGMVLTHLPHVGSLGSGASWQNLREREKPLPASHQQEARGSALKPPRPPLQLWPPDEASFCGSPRQCWGDSCEHLFFLASGVLLLRPPLV